MQTKTRMNVYFEPGLLKQVEALALRRNVSKSAVIEAAVASFLSEDSAERLEAVFARRMDRLGRQIDCMDQDLAILGETVSAPGSDWCRYGRTVRRRCVMARGRRRCSRKLRANPCIVGFRHWPGLVGCLAMEWRWRFSDDLQDWYRPLSDRDRHARLFDRRLFGRSFANAMARRSQR